MNEKGKKLGLLNLVGLGLGGAIGTGIFIMLGFGIAMTGRSIMLVCMIGCFYMLLAYWYNVGMASMFVFRGGDYGMSASLFNPLMTGVNAGFTLIQGFAVSSQAVAITGYLIMAVPAFAVHQKLIALLILTFGFAVTIGGSRIATILQNVVTVLLVLALILFIGFGIGKVDPAAFFSNGDGGFFRSGASGFIGAIAIMAFACMGTTGMVAMAAVTNKAKRNIPLAILVVTAVLAIIYGIMSYVAAGVLPYDQIAGQNISVTAKSIMPNALYMFFLIGGGICAIGSSMLATVPAFRYPLLQIAEDGWLPGIFMKQTKSGYPWVSYLFMYVVSVIPLLLGMSIDVIVSQMMIPLMLLNAYRNISCIRLPKKYPMQWEKRSIRMPLWVWCAGGVGGAVCALLISYNLFIALTLRDALICLSLVIFMIVFSAVRLKQNAVTPEYLTAVKESIVEQALLDDVN